MKIGVAWDVALSPNVSILATTTERKVTSWLVWPEKPKLTAKRYNAFGVAATAVAFAPDGLRLLIKTDRGELFVTTAINPRDLHAQLPSFIMRGPKPIFFPKGNLFVDATMRGAAVVLDVTSGELVWKHSFGNVLIPTFHSTRDGGTWMFAHGSKMPKDTRQPVTEYFTVWSHPFGEEPIGRVEPKVPLIRSSALSPDGARLALVSGEPPESLVLVDTGTDEVVARAEPIEFGGTPCNLAWSPDGKTFASVQRGRVVLYDASLRLVGQLALKFGSSLEFSSDGKCLAIGSWGTGALVRVAESF